MNVHAGTSNSLKLILLMMTYSNFLLFLIVLDEKDLIVLIVDEETTAVLPVWVGFAECL